MFSKAALITTLIAAVSGQQVGTLTAEKHPALPIKECTKSGCTDAATSVVLDANWRWLHTTEGSTNCYDGQSWSSSLCPDGATCAEKCALEGADYTGTYGVTASNGALKINFITKHQYGTNVGARVYLMASEDKYYMFKLLNKEFTFDVDVSNLPCGLNGALYLVEMPEDGGIGKGGNNAGAKYGTGYCDTQCPHDIKFIDGEANVDGWKGSPTDPSSGTGKYGACCPEMDIWEANSISTAYTPHNCKQPGLFRCEGLDCGDGADRYKSVCDKDGCDFNSFRQGNESFYGPSKMIDTTKPFTIVTQFITDDGTDTGKLKEIRRKYKQGDVVIENSKSNIEGIDAVDSITDGYCDQQKTTFEDNNQFGAMGGVATMGDAVGRGMVLALSIWDDHAAHMLWLDSTYPTDSTKKGAKRGTCATTSGDPKDVEANDADSYVIYSNIKVGELDSTL